jgi:uncharacterized membrane protein YeaQ/YmgE (transglycosylase-associated protein family)
MNAKPFVWVGLMVGSALGGIIPELWGADMLSFSSMLMSSIGAIVGIYLGFKFSQTLSG